MRHTPPRHQLPTASTRTVADLERDSLALLVGWHAEREERAASCPRPARNAAEFLAALSATIDGATTAAVRP